MRTIFLFLASSVVCGIVQAQSPTTVPVFTVDQSESTIKFSVKASVAIEGAFDKWTAALTFPSTDPKTGNLDVKIQADSVNTGSGFKNDKLKGKDFFDVK